MTETQKLSPVLIGVCAIIAVPAVLWFAFNIMWAYTWRDTTPRGPLATETEWPEPIREMHTAMAKADVDLQSFAVYLLYGQPGQTLSTVVCRMDSSSDALDVLTSHLDLKPITCDDSARWAGNEVLQYTSSDWWAPDDDDNARYYASNNLVVGDEADQYVVAHDVSRNIIFIHYYFNF